MDSTLQTVLVAVLAAASTAWIAVVATIACWGQRVRSRPEQPDGVVAYARRMDTLSRYVALPASLVALAAGWWYVAGRDLPLADNWWIGTAIGAWIVAFFGSTILRAPQLRRAVQLSGEHGAGDEDVQWRIRQADLVSRGELALLVTAAIVLLVRPA